MKLNLCVSIHRHLSNMSNGFLKLYKMLTTSHTYYAVLRIVLLSTVGFPRLFFDGFEILVVLMQKVK